MVPTQPETLPTYSICNCTLFKLKECNKKLHPDDTAPHRFQNGRRRRRLYVISDARRQCASYIVHENTCVLTRPANYSTGKSRFQLTFSDKLNFFVSVFCVSSKEFFYNKAYTWIEYGGNQGLSPQNAAEKSR